MTEHRNPFPDNDGFALPVAIGVGLIMLLLGVTMVVRSQNDQVNASAQKATAKSLAAAESGVSKVQTFLNRHRTLAMYPDRGSASWNNLGSINICPGNVNTAELAALLSTGSDWPNVDPSESGAQPLNGEFRVVDYVYDTPGTPGSNGTLTVQGRVNAGEPGESISQVQVVLPIRPVNQVATVWVRGSIADSPAIEGTVVGNCSSAPLNIGPSANLIRIDQSLSGQGIPIIEPLPASPLAVPASGPLGAENPPANTVYRYQTATLNRSLEIWSGSVVELWTSGDIDLRGQAIKCVQTDGITPCGANDPFRVTIYASGTSDIQLDEGSVLCNVHFHAPNYDVDFISGGTPAGDCTPANPSTPAVQITGAFWINSWDGDTNGVVVNPINNGPPVGAVLPPQLEPISQWETQQAVP
ncbi:hypothetical protein C1752_02695 [Acaryochloris thomasi RCC1774]|uniref:Uncharacterized protein n=1 Tax=Acaryochloris thomasi RCC1774 TaxID=1764569 RepID=A0A2W1JSV0_9CYAN|nr:hypothetical protein [Acaryochloris thomasi]PZD72974.1 hypothetical protein C1752_02695 [Acaryochloris thomasi RCC1774]